MMRTLKTPLAIWSGLQCSFAVPADVMLVSLVALMAIGWWLYPAGYRR